jgi:predicted dehydrogenase
MTCDGKIVWGLLGASNVAREWMHGSITARPDCVVASVYSRSRERADQFTKQFGAIHGDRGSIFGDEVLWQRAQGRAYVKNASGTRDIPVEHRVPYDRTIVDFVNAISWTRPSLDDGRGRYQVACVGTRGIKEHYDPYHGAAVSGRLGA